LSGGPWLGEEINMSEVENEKPFGHEVGDSVLPPNRSPHRFGPRPSSPVLAKQYDAMVEQERAKDAERADAAQRDAEIEALAQRAAAVEKRKREILNDE
jgi:hypothetical protein